MEKKQILLPPKKYEGSPEESLSVRIGLDTSQNLLRENDIDIVLDLSELFNKERNECKNYKIYGKLKMIFRNMYSGTTNYQFLKNRLYLIGDGTTFNFDGFLPYDEFAFLRRDLYREINIPESGNLLGYFNQNITLNTGNTVHTTITPITAPYQNWNLYLSYVYSADTSYPISYTLSGGTVYSFTSGDGIPFRVENLTNSYKLTSPVEHGLKQGEYIIISGGTLDNSVPISGRTFYVDSVGSEIYNSEKYVLNIYKSQFESGTTLSTVVLGKRCLDINNISLTTSKYYVHKHKTLTDSNGYIMDNIGFETPIWEDEKKLLFENYNGDNDVLVERNRMESVLFDFKEPFTLTGLTNNLNYTPTELYVTVIFRNGNGFFDYPVKVGYKFNFHDTWIDEHFDGSTSEESSLTYTTFTKTDNSITYTFKSGNTLPIGTVLIGAFVEYNENELKERIISESFHKMISPIDIFDHGQTSDISGFSGATLTNPYGLYYQPHYRVKVRELSPYIEVSETDQIYGLPENTRYFQNENLWKWRDLYDHGYIDPDGYGTNYPFLNNMHAVKLDINFDLRNEKLYTNKKDGIIKFDDINNIPNDC